MRRALAAAVLLVAAGCTTGEPGASPETTAARPGGAGAFDPGKGFEQEFATGQDTCGSYDITWDNPDPESEGELTIARDGEVVHRATTEEAFERLLPAHCADLGGDGGVDLVYERYTGGAHCCFTYTVLELEPAFREVQQLEFGNVHLGTFEQLDDDPASEWNTRSDILAYFEVSYAASPFIPMVYDWDGDRFVVNTAAFPDTVREYLTDSYEFLDETPPDDDESSPSEEIRKGIVIGLFAAYLILDEGELGLAEIKRRAPDLADWLEQKSGEISTTYAESYENPTYPLG